MVSTRRKTQQSHSDHLVGTPPAAGTEENLTDAGPSKSSVDDKTDQSSTQPGPRIEADPPEPASDLFVLDRTGADQESPEGIESPNTASSRGPTKTSTTDAQEKGSTPGRTKKKKKKKKEKNELTKLIKGYTAPMRLNASSLDQFRATGGIQALQKRAERTDASTRDFVVEATGKHTNAMQSTSNGSYTEAYSSFKKGVKRAPDTSAGKGWFGMLPTPMTEELKMDLAVLRNRNYLDPKRFYKSADQHSSVLQVGTVLEGAAEFYSSRLTKKQRKNNFTEEIMADPASAEYARNKFRDMSREKTLQAQKRGRVHKPKRGKRFF